MFLSRRSVRGLHSITSMFVLFAFATGCDVGFEEEPLSETASPAPVPPPKEDRYAIEGEVVLGSSLCSGAKKPVTVICAQGRYPFSHVEEDTSCREVADPKHGRVWVADHLRCTCRYSAPGTTCRERALSYPTTNPTACEPSQSIFELRTEGGFPTKMDCEISAKTRCEANSAFECDPYWDNTVSKPASITCCQ